MTTNREAIADSANPLRLDGIEYIEYATSKPQALGQALEVTVFRPIAWHLSREVVLYRTTARLFRIFPCESVHSDQVAEPVMRLDKLGYRGDYSFEVFNDDYQQMRKARAASAIAHVDSNDPPMPLIHSSADRVVPVSQSQVIYEALKAKGVKTELLIIPGVDHSFIGKTHEATHAATNQALEKTLEFIEVVLGGKAK